MASKVEKKSVSLPPETLSQLEWLKVNVFHCKGNMALSQQIQMAIGLAYYEHISKLE